MEEKNQINKAKWYQIIGFSGNNAATNAVFLMITLYFLIYCTEIYGFSAFLVGVIMTGTRLFDAFTDPLIGLAIDKTDTKFGRFRPWILGGALFSGLMFILMFSGIDFGSKTANMIWIITLYSLWVIGYTAQTACTKSAQTIISSVPTQRSTINALGNISTLIIYIFSAALILPIINASGGLQSAGAWQKVATLIVMVQLILSIVVVLSLKGKDTKENYTHIKSFEKPRFKDYIAIFKTNKALQMLIIAASTNKITQTMQSGLMVVFYFYVAQNQALQGIVSVAVLPIGIISSFLVIGIIQKFGRVEVFSMSSWAGMVFGVLAIFLVAINPSNAIWLIMIMGINAFVIVGAGDVNLISMIADAADYEYYVNDRFLPGMVGTAFSFIDKIVSSFGAMLSGAILTAIGFVSITETPASPKMFWGVLIMYFLFPAIGHFFSIIGMKFHPLKKDVHEKMLIDLAKK